MDTVMEVDDADDGLPAPLDVDDSGLTSNSTIGGREEKHPLMNSDVLDQVFSYLNWRSLKSARETCMSWNRAATTPLQGKTKITISYEEERLPECCQEKDIITPDPVDLREFLEYVAEVGPANVFFRNYTLAHWNMQQLDSDLEVNKFWSTCGTHIRGLRLRHCCFGSQSYVTKVFLTWTVNMEEFYLQGVGFCSPVELVTDHSDSDDDDLHYYDYESWHKNCEYEWSTQEDMKTFGLEQHIIDNNRNLKMKCFVTDGRIPLGWKDIVRVYPNLEILDVTVKDGIAKQLLLDLTEFKKKGEIVLPRLTELTVFRFWCVEMSKNPEISTEIMKLLMYLDFPIKKFKLRHDASHSTEGQILTINYMEKLLKNSLEELHMAGSFERPLFPPTTGSIQYPNLKKLTTTLSSSDSPSFEFLNKLPGLKILELYDKVSVSTRITHTRTPILLSSLVELKLTQYYRRDGKYLSCQNIQQLSEWFPNLKRFTGCLTDDLLLAVAEFFGTRLVTLKVFAQGISDRGFIGDVYDGSKDTENGDGHKAAKLQKMSSGQGVASGSRSLGIRQMIKLQRLKIHMDDMTLSNLTDACIYNGLIYLPELRTLKLTEDGNSGNKEKLQVTKSALKYYCDQSNLNTLSTPKYLRTVEPVVICCSDPEHQKEKI